MLLVFALLSVCAAALGGSRTHHMRLIPASAQAEKMHQSSGSAFLDMHLPEESSCASIKCDEDFECVLPFEKRRPKGQCCPICWAADHVLPVDRHSAMSGSNPHSAPTADMAPANCRKPQRAECFNPVCAEGKKPHHTPGRCCMSCE